MVRNNMISFWRVIFTYTIVSLHLFNKYGYKTKLGVAVEFFFIVSGWLLAVDLEKKNRDPYAYTWHRLCRLYPQYLLAFIVSASFYLYNKHLSLLGSLNWIADKGIKELLMIHYWPWKDKPSVANIPTWYLSVMIIAGLLLYSLGKRHSAALKEIILPAVIILFLSYSYLNIGDLTGDSVDFNGLVHVRFFRGFTEMGLGMLLYDLSRRITFVKKYKPIIGFAGFLSLCFVLAASFLKANGIYTYLYLLLIAIGVFVSFATELKYCKKLVFFFEKISYTIFLNHIIFRSYIIPHFFRSLSWGCYIFYIVVVTVFSIMMYYLAVAIKHLFDNHGGVVLPS